MLALSFPITHLPQITGGMEDDVPDAWELVAASILMQVWVEHVNVHRLSDTSPVLICFAIQYPYTV